MVGYVIIGFMKVKSYTVILKSEPEGGYSAIVPLLPGCVTYGKTIEKAREMAKDAIEIYIESLKKHNEEIPIEDPVYYTSVNVNLPLSYA